MIGKSKVAIITSPLLLPLPHITYSAENKQWEPKLASMGTKAIEIYGGMERTRWVFTFEQPICERKLIVQTLYSQEFLFVCQFPSVLEYTATALTQTHFQWWPLVNSYNTQIQSNSKPHKKIRIETFKRTGMKPLNLQWQVTALSRKKDAFPCISVTIILRAFSFFPVEEHVREGRIFLANVSVCYQW